MSGRPAGAWVLAFNPFELLDTAVGWIAGRAGDVIAGTAEGMLNLVAGWVIDGAFYVTGLVFDAVFAVSSPQLTSPWFSGPTGPYRMMVNVGASLLVGAVCVGVIRGVATGDVGAMTRRFALGLPGAAFILATVVVFAQVGVDVVDELSAWVWDTGGTNAEALADGLLGISDQVAATSGVIPLVMVVVAFVLMVAALLVFVVLIVRSALIYLLVALIPLAVVALVTGHRAVFAKTMELLVAFVAAKLVVVLALVLGTAAFTGTGAAEFTSPPPGGPDGTPAALVATVDGCDDTAAATCVADTTGLAQAIGAMFVGVVAFGLGTFSPWLLMRLMPGGEATQTAHPSPGGIMHVAHTAGTLRPRPRPTRGA